ncbi:MAG: VOC family protein [Rhabdochlamydiaceae bacterium]|nr:VOC family protein [Rhabdochlamydiaceae bacterium]
MTAQTLGLAWIVVNDLKKAVAFYTDVIGMKLMEFQEEFGWAELEGQKGGARLGIAQVCPTDPEGNQAGQNALITLTVENLETSIAQLIEKGAKLIGSIQEVPGHVKMQTVCDPDQNRFQLVQVLHHHQGCCSGH